jgi:hypothetical protein
MTYGMTSTIRYVHVDGTVDVDYDDGDARGTRLKPEFVLAALGTTES